MIIDDDTTVEIDLCECCVIKLVNDDVSGCKNYHGHAHDPMSSPRLSASLVIHPGDEIVNDERSWTCDGCDSDQAPFASRW